MKSNEPKTVNMKSLIRVKQLTSLAFVVVLFLFQSCSKDAAIEPDSGNNTGSGSGSSNVPSQAEFVQCKIDGADFLSYDDSRYHHYIDNNAGATKMLNLRGSNIDVNGITMLFWNFDGVGEYDISSDIDSCAIQYNIGLMTTTSYACDHVNASSGLTSGKIKVTVHNDTQIEGSFEFTAINTADPTDKIAVTEGTFRILR